MADVDRERWNRRYDEAAREYAPNAWLRERDSLIRPRRRGARALDLACGPGNNALFLAEIGYCVDAWDISDVALDALQAKIARTKRTAVTPRQVDLEGASIPPSRYDLVLDLNFLERRLFGAVAAVLRPAGLLLVRTLLRRSASRGPPIP
jgi:SAM-dependent methyltransferase